MRITMYWELQKSCSFCRPSLISQLETLKILIFNDGHMYSYIVCGICSVQIYHINIYIYQHIMNKLNIWKSTKKGFHDIYIGYSHHKKGWCIKKWAKSPFKVIFSCFPEETRFTINVFNVFRLEKLNFSEVVPVELRPTNPKLAKAI